MESLRNRNPAYQFLLHGHSNKLSGNTDAGWAGDQAPHHSAGIYLFTLYGGAASWESKWGPRRLVKLIVWSKRRLLRKLYGRINELDRDDPLFNLSLSTLMIKMR